MVRPTNRKWADGMVHVKSTRVAYVEDLQNVLDQRECRQISADELTFRQSNQQEVACNGVEAE